MCQKPEDKRLTSRRGKHHLVRSETKEYNTLWHPHKLKPITDQYDQLKSVLFTGINVFMPTQNPTGNDNTSQNDGDA